MQLFLSITAIASLLGLLSLTLTAPALFSLVSILTLLTLFIIIAIRAELAIAIFLFLLPVFGNKPGTTQAHYLLIMGMALQLGLTISIFRSSILKPSNSKFGFNNFNKGLLSGFWYTVISILSLFPVSFLVFWGWFKSSQSSLANISLLNWNFSSILLAREDSPSYPLLSVFWTLLAFSLSYFVCFYCRKNPFNRSKFSWSLLSGFLVSLVVGLLNYYGLINLLALRELDPVVNPGGTQYRLQSWFGHSGWFAEYVTMLAPFSMLVLTLALAFWKRVSILLFLLLVGEIILILTFQRGGWLSYPLTLLAIWASIYVIRRLEAGDLNILSALKSSTIKILISLPLTILVSLLIINLFGSQFGLDQYKDRFKDIAKASDRTEFIKAGFKLGRLNPIFGLGSESFALQYRREFKERDGAYSGQIDLPLHGTAHNLYAQTFAGKGALGLIALIIVMLCSISRAFSFVFSKEPQASHSDRIIALACACSIIAALIYGFVQELFYVQSLQYVFFAVVGIIASLPLSSERTFLSRHFSIALALGLLFIFHLSLWAIGSRKYSDALGCYPIETGQNGERWQWCGLRSSIDMELSSLIGKDLSLQIAPHAGQSTAKQNLKIEACNQVIFSKEVAASESVKFKVEPEKLGCADAGYLRLNAALGMYFIPAKENPASEDRRVLALRWLLN